MDLLGLEEGNMDLLGLEEGNIELLGCKEGCAVFLESPVSANNSLPAKGWQLLGSLMGLLNSATKTFATASSAGRIKSGKSVS
mmetsp:Transcript_39903/g.81469  ORF Transcript_39903/g.81469 Transcript_39903/m.81469 type:complete len:83 (+) Transcript_39903:311-559(+)